jgi:hypothetical protein
MRTAAGVAPASDVDAAHPHADPAPGDSLRANVVGTRGRCVGASPEGFSSVVLRKYHGCFFKKIIKILFLLNECHIKQIMSLWQCSFCY